MRARSHLPTNPKRHRRFGGALQSLAACITAPVLILSVAHLRADEPPNDQFTNRTALVGTNLTVTGWNTNASKEIGEPNHAGNLGGQSVLWTWTAPSNSDVTINTD